MARHNFDMTEGPLLKKTILFAIPLILTGILQLLFNAADLMVIGTVDETFVGAVGATGSLTSLMVNLFLGIGGGVSVVVAQALGARDNKKTQAAIHTAIPVALICGVLLSVVGYFCSAPMLKLMGTPEEIIDYSTLYMQIYFMGMVPSLLYNFGAGILRAAGDTKSPLYFLTISGVINVVLNLIFVKVFKMTVDGVALATAISQAVSAALVLIALMKRHDACHLDLKELTLNKEALKKIITIGLPAGCQSSLYSVANIIIQSSVNSFGAISVIGNSAAINLEGFAYVVINSFYQSAMAFTGQNVGANKYDRVKKVFMVNALCVTVAGIVVGILFNVFLTPLLSLYNVTDPVALKFARIRMLFITLPYFSCGVCDVVTGILRGMGASFIPMLISIICICGLRLAWIFTIFKMHHTPESLFIIYPISWIIAFIAEYIAYNSVLNMRKRKFLQEEKHLT